MEQKKIFPKNFFWGASTASHQVEGNTLNQWSVWELAHASELSKDVQRSTYPPAPKLPELEIWPDIKSAVTNPDNYVSGEGIDHYKRYKEDIALATKLNLNSLRFGIEWSRMEPEEGVWNEEAITHYQEYIRELRRAGLEPFLNLWHWTHPVWFEEKGGWSKRSNLKYFDRFVEKVSSSLCEEVTYILTINEANSFSGNGYMYGVWPPGQKNTLESLKVYYYLMLAHKRAYSILKRANPKLKVGVAHQPAVNRPVNPKNLLHQLFTRGADYYTHNWYYKRLRNHQDFLGMNFYFVNYLRLSIVPEDPPEPLSDMGWYMEPKAIGELASKIYKKHKLPIIITENGVADMHDKHRQWWIEETINGLDEAINNGADIRGYLHWSLLDNFEWAEGWWPKFGLIEVDRKNGQKRTVRPSAKWYAKKIESLQQD